MIGLLILAALLFGLGWRSAEEQDDRDEWAVQQKKRFRELEREEWHRKFGYCQDHECPEHGRGGSHEKK